MKIFGKRKTPTKAAVASDSTATPHDDAPAEKCADTTSPKTEDDDEDVPSYFSGAQPTTSSASAKKKKYQKDPSTVHNGDDMQALLAMDPTELNAKQRRLVKRHNSRKEPLALPDESEENATEETAANETETKTDNVKATSKIVEQTKEPQADGADPKDDAPNSDQEKAAPADANITEILAKLEGLNSKDRRKFLRQLKSSSGGTIDESVIAAAQEQAKKVAERNEKEAANPTTSDKRKTTGETTPAATKPKKKRRKKGPPVNLADLTPDERKRREEQRRMQVEAVERRAAGLVDPSRHPLNSERRRANRRKPSKNALIAMEKRAKIAERGKFNAFGYNMRRDMKGGGES